MENVQEGEGHDTGSVTLRYEIYAVVDVKQASEVRPGNLGKQHARFLDPLLRPAKPRRNFLVGPLREFAVSRFRVDAAPFIVSARVS
jgi:hypothetical protein